MAERAAQRTATCGCGALRLVATGEPVRVGVCHCLTCQRRSGSAFAYQARFARDAVRMSGEPAEYVRISDDGERRVFSFCAQCGTTVWFASPSEPDLVAVPVGGFADPEFPAPIASGWEERRHAWVTIAGDEIRHFD